MVQRTQLQTYREIKAALKAGTCSPKQMGSNCFYRKADNKSPTGFIHCGVGVLFNEAQLDDIAARGMLGHSVGEITDAIGIQNMLEVTGLNFSELSDLQNCHDTASQSGSFASNKVFRAYIDKKIKEHA